MFVCVECSAVIVNIVRLGYIWLGDCPAGLELPPGARNKRKATVKENTKYRPLRGAATKGTIPKKSCIFFKMQYPFL